MPKTADVAAKIAGRTTGRSSKIVTVSFRISRIA